MCHCDTDVLGDLAEISSRIAELERLRRELIAYARHHARPRPYLLKDLAHATGMSISGVRSAYTRADVDAADPRHGL